MFEDSIIEAPKRPTSKLQRFFSWVFVALAVAYVLYVQVVIPVQFGAIYLANSFRDFGVWIAYLILFLAYTGQLAKIFAYIGVAMAVGVMVLMPLIFTEALPKTVTLGLLVAPPPPPPPPPPAAAPVKIVKVIQTDIINGELRTPTKIPKKVQMIKEDEAPPPVNTSTGVFGGVPGGVPGGSASGVLGSILSAGASPTVAPKIAAPQRVRVSSGVVSGLLLRKVQPTYPPLARAARIQGVVILQAQISKEGNIENLQLISGHPMLAPAAIEAVKQWKYKPYLLNGEPVEVETQVQVNFNLAGG